MIQIDQVSKHFSNERVYLEALTNITLNIEEREIIGVVGESGSGKSTLLRLLDLMEDPTNGRILIDGQDTQQISLKKRRQLKKEIGLVFQQFNLLSNKTVADNVALPLKLVGQKDANRVQEMLRFVGLNEKANVYPRHLSGGQKQRVAIARALINQPRLLLCDEPTSSLDTRHTFEIIQLLKKAHEAYQPTIVFVSHEIDVIQQLCQRVIVLERGKLVGIVENMPHVRNQFQETYYQHVIERLRQ